MKTLKKLATLDQLNEMLSKAFQEQLRQTKASTEVVRQIMDYLKIDREVMAPLPLSWFLGRLPLSRAVYQDVSKLQPGFNIYVETEHCKSPAFVLHICSDNWFVFIHQNVVEGL